MNLLKNDNVYVVGFIFDCVSYGFFLILYVLLEDRK